MSINPLNDISRVYLEQVAAVEEGVRPTPVDKPLDKAAFKKRRRSLAGKEKSAEARKRGHEGKEWYNSGRTYSPDEAKFGRANMPDHERSTRHRSAVDPEAEDDNYSADKTKNPKKLRKQKAMGELGEEFVDPEHGEAPSGRSPLQNVSDHPKTSVRKTAVKGFKKQMEKEYGGKWKSRSSDPVSEAKKNDGNLANNYPPYDKVTRGDIIAGATGNDEMGGKKKKRVEEGNDGNLANNYPPYDKVTRGDVIAGRLGKDEMGGKKKKTVREGYSNWREDLIEVSSADTKGKTAPIKEKNIDNTSLIKINPVMKETTENLGGTLLEMVEFEGVLDEFNDHELRLLSNSFIESVVEEFFLDCLGEGYDLEQVEDMLIESIDTSAAILNEARVTLGHDTDIKSDRLEKVKSAVKKVGKAVARGAGYVAGAAVRGARALGREASAGYSRGRGGSSSSSGSSGSSSSGSSGSSGSSSSGSSSTSRGGGLLSRLGSKLRRGLGKAIRGAGKAVGKVVKHAKAGYEEGRGKTSSTSAAKPAAKPAAKAEKPADPWEGSATTPPKTKAKTKKAAAPKAKAPAKKKDKLDSLLADIRKEEAQLREKELIEAAKNEKAEEIVRSMKKNAAGFKKRYGDRWKEVIYATANKLAEQIMETQPKTETQPQQSQQPDPRAKAIQQRDIANKKRLLQQKMAALSKGSTDIDV